MMKKSKLYIFALWFILFNAYLTSAQIHPKEASRWVLGYYFGKEFQINFNTPTPTSDTLVPQTSPDYLVSEGGTSICDTNGNLLFFTSGRQVWNKDYVLMTNGGFITGNGAGSSTQGSLIVKKPSSNSQYYIFTTPTIELGYQTEGLRYHIVDMQQSGGLGSVVIKDVILYGNPTEKICAVLHHNKRDIWIVSHEHGTNSYRAYLLTQNGIAIQPIISSEGSVVGSLSFDGLEAGRGQMKISPDGRKICMAVTSEGPGSFIELCDFDDRTGRVFNPARLNFYNIQPNPFSAYGVEFSPNNQYLYVNNRNGALQDSLFQFSLCAGTNQQILKTKTLVFTHPTLAAENGSLQLSPNGKIYVARRLPKGNTTYFGVIEQPNLPFPLCNYQPQGLPTASINDLAAPNFCASIFNQTPPLNAEAVGFCFGDTTFFTVGQLACSNTKYLWNFGDSLSGGANTDTMAKTHHIYSQPGNYKASVYITQGQRTDTFAINVNILAPFNNPILGPRLVCPLATDTFSVAQPDSNYRLKWQSSATVSMLSADSLAKVVYRFDNATDSALLQLIVSNTFGCKPDTITKYIKVSQNKLPRPIGPTTICLDGGNTVKYYIEDSKPQNKHTYRVIGGTINGATTLDTVNVQWDVNQTEHSIQLLDMFNPTWGDTCLIASDTLKVKVEATPTTKIIKQNTLVCEGDEITYNIEVNNNNNLSKVEWETKGKVYILGYPTQSSVLVKFGGGLKFTILATQVSELGCKGTTDSISISDTCFFIPNVITPNNDMFNDVFYIKRAELYRTQLTIFNRWGLKVYQTDEYDNKWNAEGLTNGLYFYSLEINENGTIDKRVGYFSVLK